MNWGRLIVVWIVSFLVIEAFVATCAWANEGGPAAWIVAVWAWLPAGMVAFAIAHTASSGGVRFIDEREDT